MTSFTRKFLSVILAVAMVAVGVVPVSVVPVQAAAYDLTMDVPTTTVTINGALWAKLASADPTGSGVFYSFLRIQKSGTERGYNTDYRPLQFDENSSQTFTHSYLLKDVPKVRIGGTIYREFQLDVNEQNSSPDWYISLDKFQVWITNTPELTGYNEATNAFASGATKVYDLDQGTDNWIKMDYRVNTGSGKRDYKVLVPQANFEGVPGAYVVIFTRFGDNYETDDGFEEWGVAQYPATIEGYKWHDRDADGVWDGDEEGLNGWTVNLSGGGTNLSAVTANDPLGNPGYFKFSVNPGDLHHK